MSLAHHRNILAGVMGDISAYEYHADRPLLSVVAVLKNTYDHGKGLYALCEQLGIGEAQELARDLYGISRLILALLTGYSFIIMHNTTIFKLIRRRIWPHLYPTSLS
ncbi:hypothetical protein [Hymenobacter crusticola]|uniref:Uncharacterized protein n=1 Tax=Hymenobacter crusticola TaxID=1770526 RepID=A0A243W805_9BACT|nr:hypothetical protein [Hymenobacter crusticola]OUJ69935.1 hypothetical protein BXP70_25680 [Hymenobacter crusticola]